MSSGGLLSTEPSRLKPSNCPPCPVPAARCPLPSPSHQQAMDRRTAEQFMRQASLHACIWQAAAAWMGCFTSCTHLSSAPRTPCNTCPALRPALPRILPCSWMAGTCWRIVPGGCTWGEGVPPRKQQCRSSTGCHRCPVSNRTSRHRWPPPRAPPPALPCQLPPPPPPACQPMLAGPVTQPTPAVLAFPRRIWTTRNFLKGLELCQRIGEVAEAEGHHPDLHLTGWGRHRCRLASA